MKFNKPPEWGKRFDFPENIQVEYNGVSGMVTSEIAIKMAERYDDAVAEEIAREAKLAGAASCTVLNKAAILEALERRTPKKTIWGGDHNTSWRSCPTCHSKMHKSFKFCSQCGQALDWRNDNGK